MSKPRNRNSLLASHRSTYSNSNKDELISMKFSMKKPDVLLYPLNDIEQTNVSGNTAIDLTYPDFKPWKDHTQEEGTQEEVSRLNNTNYLNKGYFESPIVSNEYYSARNLIQATIFSSTENCNNVLKELSQHLANGYKTRNEVINKIKYSSNNFRIPPRVTLTITKKEQWLKDLANPRVPLSKISEKLPHGIRNKVLIENVCSKNVPISRAIWFTKCVLYGELITLRRKHQLRNNHSEDFELHWLKEWTQQVADYIFKFSKDMHNLGGQEKKSAYMHKLRCLLQYVQTLYVECLLDKYFFLSLTLKFLKEGLPLKSKQVGQLVSFFARIEDSGDNDENELHELLATVEYGWINDIELNLGSRLISLTLIKIFWKDLVKGDYLCKELCELLLLNHYFISKVSYIQKKATKAVPEAITTKVSRLISDHVTYLFQYNTDAFILPNYWILIYPSLVKILREGDTRRSDQEKHDIQSQLEIIKYRNESLVLNARHTSIKKSTFSDDVDSSEESDHTYINRSSNDILRFIHSLDGLKLGELADSLRPEKKALNNGLPDIISSSSWRTNLSILIHWSITSYRSVKESSENILIISNFLKKNVLSVIKNTSVKPSLSLTEFENEILEIIYGIVESKNLNINNYSLYVLINELYQLKVITISSYLRKLIASGIFYSSDDQADLGHNHLVQTHLKILQNLPVLNNRQCDSILKKWTPNGFDFNEKFVKGKEVLEKEILELVKPGPKETSQTQLDVTDPSHPLYYIINLNVGLKFLLINWVTTELKQTITKSPKLIHVTPNTVARLYKFYSLCDNLTVFFKVLIKAILKNDGGVIILYMDTLYLIARLVIRHFKLIKFMGVSGENSGYELFKLIVLYYKDLSSQEYDYFKFDQVWRFIDSSVQKNNTDEEKYKAHPLLNTDSPLKIGELKQDGRSPEYSYVNFREDLERFTNSPRKFDDKEVEEILKELGITEEDAMKIDFVDHDQNSSVFTQLLDLFFSSIVSNECYSSKEVLVVKALINTQNKLDLLDTNRSATLMEEFVTSKMNGSDETNHVALFLQKLVVFEIITINKLVADLQKLKEDTQKLIYRVVLSDPVAERSWPASQTLLLNLIRDWFKFSFSNHFTFIILNGLKDYKESIFSSVLLTDYPQQTIDFLNHLAVTNTNLFMNELILEISSDDSILLLNTMLHNSQNSEKYVESLADFDKVSSSTEEFNLPLVQILIRVVSSRELSGLNHEEVCAKLKQLVETFIDHLHFEFTSSNSYFGELFNYMTWEHKKCILSILENYILLDTQFEPNLVTLTRNTVNLLPVLNDFLKKFSTSSISIVESSGPFFQNLQEFLAKLLQTVTKDQDQSIKDTGDISSVISIFLRILIIHKATLTKRIVNHDSEQFSFITNLISLLNSDILKEGNEKLKILLYDLLLLLKSSITDLLTVNPDLENTPLDYDESQKADTTGTENDWGATPGESGPPASAAFVNTPTSQNGGGYGTTPGATGTPGVALATSGSVTTPIIPSLGNANLLASIFILPEPSHNNPLKPDDSKVRSVMTLDENELQKAGDIHLVNESNLALVPTKCDSATLSTAFGILSNQRTALGNSPYYPYKLKSFELLEDASHSLNDACINLQLLDAYTTRENPP